MIPGYIGQQISRTNRNLLIINGLLVVIISAILILTRSYLYECFTGPVSIDADDIAKLESADQAPRKFVHLHIDPAKLDDNMYFITGGNDDKNDQYYFLHLDNGRVLIIKAHTKELPDEFEGSITTWDNDVRDKVLPGVQDKIKGPFSQVLLDLSSYRSGMYVMLAIFIPLLGLAIWNISKAIIRMGNPARHPVAVQLAKFGPPEEIAVGVDAEYRTSAERTGWVTLTQSWLMRPSLTGLALVYLGDVVWAYKKEIKHKSYGITTKRTFSTVIYENSGKSREFSLNEKQVLTLLAELARRVPWAIIGYTPELVAAWKHQRPQFLASVEERKKQAMNAPPKPPA